MSPMVTAGMAKMGLLVRLSVLALVLGLQSPLTSFANDPQTLAVQYDQESGISLSPGFALQSVSPIDLTTNMVEQFPRVAEFSAIQQIANSLGIHVYLYGGAASTFAYYAKLHLLQNTLDPGFAQKRLQFEITQIYRNDQDVDLAVDAPLEKIEEFERQLQSRYPYSVEGKSVWEIRSLRESYKGKSALFGNPDYFQQNLDSASTGLFSLTHTESHFSDLIDPAPRFSTGESTQWIQDIAEGKITFYRNPSHSQTHRAREGQNPEIISAIRALVKASQFGLKISGIGLRDLSQIISEAQPSEFSDYVKNKLEVDARKIFSRAMDIEYAMSIVRVLKLHEAQGLWSDQVTTLFNREPLFSINTLNTEGWNDPAKVAPASHASRTITVFESLQSNPFARPNALISRQGQLHEGAGFGNGFYTYAFESQHQDPNSEHLFSTPLLTRTDSPDFSIHGNERLWKDRSGLKVDHIRLSATYHNKKIFTTNWNITSWSDQLDQLEVAKFYLSSLVPWIESYRAAYPIRSQLLSRAIVTIVTKSPNRAEAIKLVHRRLLNLGFGINNPVLAPICGSDLISLREGAVAAYRELGILQEYREEVENLGVVTASGLLKEITGSKFTARLLSRCVRLLTNR